MKNSPLVSIVIINHNQLKVTSEFLASLNELSYTNYEVILVDNASNENPSSFIHQKFPFVKVVINDKNLGFTGGNNSGINVSKGDFIFIVNNDTEVTADLIDRLLEPFEIDEAIGIVSPKIKFFSNPNIIQFAGFNAINPITGRNSAVGSLQPDDGKFDQSGYTNYAHGAAMLVKREVFEKIGVFPDHFFIYYEELDFSVRAKKAGFQIYYQSQAVIYHKESITMGKESAIKAYYHNRNRIMFMRRNSTHYQFFLFILFYSLLTFPKSIFKYLINFRFKHMCLFLKGVLWNITTSRKTILLNNYLLCQ